MPTGRIAGIARHDRPFGPMETLDHVSVTAAEGVHGDFRGARASTKPTRKRQVSLIETACVTAAFAESGARIAVGATLVIEITDECEPCERMDALHEGLRAALTPDWRGGFLGRVIQDGEIAVGDEIRIL